MTAPAAISPLGSLFRCSGPQPAWGARPPPDGSPAAASQMGRPFLRAATERRSGCTAPLGSRRSEMPPQRAVQPLFRRRAPPGWGIGLAAGPAESGQTAGIRPIDRSAKPNATYDKLHTSGTGVRASSLGHEARCRTQRGKPQVSGRDQGDAGASRAARGAISWATRPILNTARRIRQKSHPIRRTSSAIPHATHRKHRTSNDKPRTAAARPRAAYRVPQTSLAKPRASCRTP